jgi:predicted SAM-dependent methyltransferase
MTKLHIGSGPQILEGWVNIDNAKYPGVDRVLDVTGGLPFENASFIFAEHFIEHLSYPDAAALMRECRRVLSNDGVLRLSTPNLDWVWFTHYRMVGQMTEREEVQACFAINRAFRGWGHQFLYNERTLRSTLLDAGFSNVVRCEYGVSTHSELHGLERHELSPAWGTLESILIVEASGCGGKAPEDLAASRADFLRDVSLK